MIFMPYYHTSLLVVSQIEMAVASSKKTASVCACQKLRELIAALKFI